jgi:hypothetical protein
MTSTGISETNRAILEDKYDLPWHRTPENRAFLGARQKCEQPSHPHYDSTGARGIRFLYDSLDDLLADIGFRPSENFALERIDMNKHFEPGNVRWSPMIVINRKHRPQMQVERTLETMMVKIIHTLKRQPNMELSRSKLQHSSGSSEWGATVFHDAVQQLITLGFISYTVVERTQTEPDGHHPGLTRRVTRKVPIVRLKQEIGQKVEQDVGQSVEQEVEHGTA